MLHTSGNVARGLRRKIEATPKKGTIWAKIYGLIDWAAINIGKAKDKGE